MHLGYKTEHIRCLRKAARSLSAWRMRYRYHSGIKFPAKLEGEDITDCVEQLEGIGKQYNITFVLSVSMDKEELPEGMQDKIIVAL